MAKAHQQYYADEVYLQKQAREFSPTQDLLDMIGGEANVIEEIRVNGTPLVPDQDKAVDISVPLVEDSLTSTSSVDALSAGQGKILYDMIVNHTNGRFLSNWNCVTGLPVTSPETDPYVYMSGDYYIVSAVSNGGTNYRPTGSAYTIGVASTDVETETVTVGDFYFYDGTIWNLQPASAPLVDSSLSLTSRNPVENRVITAALNGKEDFVASATVPTSARTGTVWLNFTDNQYEIFDGVHWLRDVTMGVNKIFDGSVLELGQWAHGSTFDSSGHHVTIDPAGSVTTYNATTGGANTGVLDVNGLTLTMNTAMSGDETAVYDNEKIVATDGVTTNTFNFFGTGNDKIARLSDIAGKANVADVLTLTNTTAYTPTANYNPATKKYVDDSVSAVDEFEPGNVGTTGQVLKKTANGYEWANESGGGGGGIQLSPSSPIQLDYIWAGYEDDYANISTYDNTTAYLVIEGNNPGGGWQPTANTLGYYPLNSIDTNTDQSGNSRDLGTNYGSVTYGTYHGVDCAYFNVGELRTSAFTGVAFNNTLTTSIWYYQDNTPNNDNGTIMRAREDDNGPDFGPIVANGWPDSKVGVCGYATDSYYTYATAATQLTSGWHHICQTYDNGTHTIYIDGVATGTMSFTLGWSTVGMLQLSRDSDLDRSIKGCLSEAIFEKKCWSATEVLNYYNQTKNNYGWQPGANTIAYYPLTSTTTTSDESGNGYTLSNGSVTFIDNYAVWSSETYLSNSSLVIPSGDFYMGVWVRGTSFPSYSPRLIIPSGTRSIYMAINNPSDNNGTFLFDDRFGSASGIKVGSNIAVANKWYYVFISRESGVTTCGFIDNGTMSTGTGNAGLNGTGIVIGYNEGNPGSDYFLGNMSDLIIESVAWTTQEIQNYYDQTKSNYGIN